MVNETLIDSWQEGQRNRPQPRWYTPGNQTTQVSSLQEGRPVPLDLLVIEHGDAVPRMPGMRRLDVMLDSGSGSQAAQYTNGHLVNRYDEDAGVTDHTLDYLAEEGALLMADSSFAPASEAFVPASPTGPAARVRSVRAMVAFDPWGRMKVDTRSPVMPGREINEHTLREVQQGMQLAGRVDGFAQARAQRLEVGHPSAEQHPESREVGVSSQAGLGAAHGPRRSFRSVPAPGELGSPSNPIVRERRPLPVGSSQMQESLRSGTEAAPSASRAVPAQGKVSKVLASPVTKEALTGAVNGAALAGRGGLYAGLAGAATGAVAGAARALQATEPPAAQEVAAAAARRAEVVPGGGQVVKAPPPISETYPYKFEQPPVASSERAAGEPVPLSERYPYKFEGVEPTSDEQQLGR